MVVLARWGGRSLNLIYWSEQPYRGVREGELMTRLGVFTLIIWGPGNTEVNIFFPENKFNDFFKKVIKSAAYIL